jgi:hypothetical protein
VDAYMVSVRGELDEEAKQFKEKMEDNELRRVEAETKRKKSAKEWNAKQELEEQRKAKEEAARKAYAQHADS